jgi:hypothetical protein
VAVTTVSGEKKRQILVPDLVEALSQGLHERDASDDSWDELELHASDLAASESVVKNPVARKCARQLKMRLNGVDQRKHTDGELLMFDQGQAIHERLSQLIESGFKLVKSGWIIAYTELPSSDNLPGDIEGTLDVMLYGPNGEKVIVDYKTLRGGAFRWLTRVKEANKLQIQSYMMAHDADFGIVVYVDREGSNFARQFVVQRDDEAVILAQREVEALRASATLPPVITADYGALRETKKKGLAVPVAQPWQCTWCRYHVSHCPGAVPEDLVGKVAGHVVDGDFVVREGFESVAEGLRARLEQAGKLGGGDVEETNGNPNALRVGHA